MNKKGDSDVKNPLSSFFAAEKKWLSGNSAKGI